MEFENHTLYDFQEAKGIIWAINDVEYILNVQVT